MVVAHITLFIVHALQLELADDTLAQLHQVVAQLEQMRPAAKGTLRVVEQQARLRGYLAEASLWRIEVGAQGLFITSADPWSPGVPVQLTEVDVTGSAYLDQPALGPLVQAAHCQKH